MKNGDNVQTVINVYGQTNPHIILGYSEDLKKYADKDFNTLLNISQQKEAMAKEAEGVNS